MTLNHLSITATQKWIFPFFLLLFLKNGIAQDQNKIDSLLTVYTFQNDEIEKVKILNELFRENLDLDQAKALEFLKEQLRLSEKLKYKDGIAECISFI